VGVQRREKKKYEAGLQTTMDDKKLQHLSDMDFQWSLKKDWNQRYEELREFKEEHGHCRVPRKGKLGSWVDLMRSKARRPKCKEKIDKLEAIGFFERKFKTATTMPSLNESVWNQRFEELKNFQEEHGHCRVPQRLGKLGRWLKTQRERTAGLEAIGFFDA
jgi:hypothetical protein